MLPPHSILPPLEGGGDRAGLTSELCISGAVAVQNQLNDQASFTGILK